MAQYLLDWCASSMRTRALTALTRSVKPALPLAWLVRILGFEDSADARVFLRKCGGVLVEAPAPSEAMLDCAASAIVPVRSSLATDMHEEAQSAGFGVLEQLRLATQPSAPARVR